MIGEMDTREVKTMHDVAPEGFHSIKPQEGMSVRNAKNYWDTMRPSNQDVSLGGNNDADNHLRDTSVNEIKTARYIETRNSGLENDRHPITGVPFERRTVDLPDGDKVEGVFPRFDSMFDAKIPEDMYLKDDVQQFKECSKQLVNAIEHDPDLKNRFSEDQIAQIYEGVSTGNPPDGYVWHHDAEAGKIQLVDFETHEKTGHTGGRSLWGGGSDCR